MPTRDRSTNDTDRLLLLWAARRSGVLDALLTTAGTPAAVAETAGVPERAATRFVTALADAGYLTRVGEEYEITNRALGLLAKRDLRSIGRLPHELDRLDLWADLPSRLAREDSDDDGADAPPTFPAEWTRNRLGAHAATDEATVRACVSTAVRAAPEATRAVDVCGASGVYAAEFAARGLTATLVDGHDVLDAVTPLLERRGVDAVAGGAEDFADAAKGVDVVFLADAHRLEAATLRGCLAEAESALRPPGVVVLTLLQRRVRAAADALLTGRGDVHAEDDVRGWLTESGFDATIRAVPGTDYRAAVGHRAVE